MELFRGRYVRTTPEGIFVNIPILDSGGKYEFGPFAVPHADLFYVGENVTVLSRDELREDMVIVGLPFLYDVTVISSGDSQRRNGTTIVGGGA